MASDSWSISDASSPLTPLNKEGREEQEATVTVWSTTLIAVLLHFPLPFGIAEGVLVELGR